MIRTQSFSAYALFLAERIQTRGLEKEHVIAKLPLTLQISGNGYVVIFRYGVIVFFNADPEHRREFLKHLQDYLVQPFTEAHMEEVALALDRDVHEGMKEDKIYLQDAGIPRLQLVAEILAKSLVLDHYEGYVVQNLELIEPLVEKLKRKGLRGLRAGVLLRQLADALLSLHRMLGIVEVSEKPELLWEHPELERLYARLEDEYELRERHRALDRKVELSFRTADTLQDLLQTKRTLRVEWYIVILIVIEIMIYLYEIFL